MSFFSRHPGSPPHTHHDRRSGFLHAWRGVQRAFHYHPHHPPRRRSSLSLADEAYADGRLNSRHFSIATASESQLYILPPSARYDGSISVDTSRRASRLEAVSRVFFPGVHYVSDSAPSYTTTSSSVEIPRAGFSTKALLDLSDSVRQSLASTGLLGPDAERLLEFLDMARAEEVRGVAPIDIETIKLARLDKLLADMVDHAERETMGSAKGLSDFTAAEGLQRAWRARFKAEYFTLDETRAVELSTCGRLENVSFVSSTGGLGVAPGIPTSPSAWRAEIDPSPDANNNIQFEVGHWVLNLACAHRDGLVNTSVEKVTTGKYTTATLPLMTGREDYIQGTRTRYFREGSLADMHVSLLLQVGRAVRVLRGFQLRSHYAPSAGVRYDGMWKISSYRQKLDVNTDTYHLEIALERLPSQTPMVELLKIPTPSQLDDWHLYEKIEADKIRQTTGEHGAFEWKVHKEEEKLDREQWKRVREFRSSISRAIGTVVNTTDTSSPMAPPTVAVFSTTAVGKSKTTTAVASSPKKKSAIKLTLPPNIQVKADKAAVAAAEKRAVIDTDRNLEYEPARRHESSSGEPEQIPRDWWLAL